MVDTNVIISAMVFKSAKMTEVLREVTKNHELCLSSFGIDEVKRILSEKFAGAETSVAAFFEDYPYTLIEVPVDENTPLVKMRDANDYPILHAAIIAQVDLLITGDKDFFDVKVDRPDILAPLDFLTKYWHIETL